MAYNDPGERAAMRLEMRRFVSRCDTNEALVRRADTLRELGRLAATPIPYKLSAEVEAREAMRRLELGIEDRAKELIQSQIASYAKADPDHRGGFRSKMMEDWGNLSGPLAHLRTWATGKLMQAEQMLTDRPR